MTALRPARELARRLWNLANTGYDVNALTAVIEARDREVVEAAAQVITDARGECNDDELRRRIRAIVAGAGNRIYTPLSDYLSGRSRD